MRKSVAVDDETLQQMASPEKTPEEWMEAREDQEHLLQQLGSLKSSYQEVIICRALMDMTSQETAAVLGWSRNRVDVTLSRALKSLRAGMTEQLGGSVNDLAKRT